MNACAMHKNRDRPITHYKAGEKLRIVQLDCPNSNHTNEFPEGFLVIQLAHFDWREAHFPHVLDLFGRIFSTTRNLTQIASSVQHYNS